MPAISVIVSLKVFVVELKYNCPSVIWLNVDGAVNSSVGAGERPGSLFPNENKAAEDVP